MTLFFDLNLPCHDTGIGGGGGTFDSSVLRAERLRSLVRAMELGYSGVAYNCFFRGVLSERDRCSIAPFPLPSLLDASPTLSASVSFQRRLLGTPCSAVFRQYSRITVLVDSQASAASLRGENSLLWSYDLVAARPLNQGAFDKLCSCSEVDLISIDFSEKLPYSFKLSSIETAIKRGIHFEITYSHLIVDVQIRRIMLPEAKQLVDCTRGRNLIISSAASDAKELRGPCDVQYLFVCLLGLSMKRAKMAISENCSSLMAKALKRKHFFKEAIRIERLHTNGKVPEGPWYLDSGDWDPFSSAEGDLPPLDEIRKVFSAVNEPAKISVSTAAKQPDFNATASKNDARDGSLLKLSLNFPNSFRATNEFSLRARSMIDEQSLVRCPIANTNPETVQPLRHSSPKGNLLPPDIVTRLHADTEDVHAVVEGMTSTPDVKAAERMTSTLELKVADGMTSTLELKDLMVSLAPCTTRANISDSLKPSELDEGDHNMLEIVSMRVGSEDERLGDAVEQVAKDYSWGASSKEGLADQSDTMDDDEIPSDDALEQENAFGNSPMPGDIDLLSIVNHLNSSYIEAVEQKHDLSHDPTPYRVKSGKKRHKGRSTYLANLMPLNRLVKSMYFKKRTRQRPIRWL